MIACPNCNTLNPDGERLCLSCRTPLPPAPGAGAGGAEPQATTRCPNGHPIDPSWRSCPYCTNSGSADPPTTRLEGGPLREDPTTRLESGTPAVPPPAPDRRTRLDGEPPPAAPPPPPAPAPGGPPRPTRLEEPPGAGPATQRTVLQSSAPAPAPSGGASEPEPPPPAPPAAPRPAAGASGHGPEGDTRPLVGVLAAPDAVPGGLLFPLRAGKNRIGGEPRSEIRLDHDPRVSKEHALILHRGGNFYLSDRMSTNGTFLNGEEVDPATNATRLEDRARIRCGDTELIFFRLDEAAEASG